MRRRDFIAGIAGSVAAWPPVVRAQRPELPIVGFLHFAKPETYAHVVAAFRAGLKEGGFVEGQNVTIEFRWAHGQSERLPALAADLVRRQVTVMAVGGGPLPALAAKAATSTIPIVVAFGADPIKLGLAASLSRPGGNVTGATFLTSELGSKRLGLLSEMVPHAMTIGFLVDPRHPATKDQTTEILAAARVLDRQIVVVEARSEREFVRAFANLTERGARALLVAPPPIFTGNRGKLIALAASHRIPAMYHDRSYVIDGGLMSYGASVAETFRLGGVYVAKILNGAKPADLPFQQSSKFDLVINLKTANALRLTVPPMLLARADEVIE